MPAHAVIEREREERLATCECTYKERIRTLRKKKKSVNYLGRKRRRRRRQEAAVYLLLLPEAASKHL